MTPKEAERLLNSFYDMPEQIAQLRDEIATLYADRNAASVPALSEYYREEIEAKQAQLEHIQRTYHTLQPCKAVPFGLPSCRACLFRPQGYTGAGELAAPPDMVHNRCGNGYERNASTGPRFQNIEKDHRNSDARKINSGHGNARISASR